MTFPVNWQHLWSRARPLLVWGLGLFFGLPAVYLGVATPGPGPVLLEDTPVPQQAYDLYVANWGFHTSIIVAQPQGWQLGPPEAAGARFVEYSWGDRNFYMRFQRDLRSAVRALTLPTASVMYVQGWTRPPALADGMQQLYHRRINAQQWQTLIHNLEQDFVRTPTGERSAALAEPSPYQGRFYSARAFYIGWSNCNAWTVRHLADIHSAHDSWGILFAQQVAAQLRSFAPIQGPKV